MPSWYLLSGSTYANDIDFVINLVGVLVGFWFIVTEGIFFWLIWRFRHRPGVRAQYLVGDEKPVKRVISTAHWLIIICDIAIIFYAVQTWYNVKQYKPEPELTIRIIGQQWAWSFVHPGADKQLDTPDDIKTVDELHVTNETVYHFELESRDVLHSFSIPIFRLKQDVIPGRRITGWFEPTVTGTYDLQCAEMCGIGHGIMAATVTIRDAEDHALWIAANTPADSTAALVPPTTAPSAAGLTGIPHE